MSLPLMNGIQTDFFRLDEHQDGNLYSLRAMMKPMIVHNRYLQVRLPCPTLTLKQKSILSVHCILRQEHHSIYQDEQ